MLATSNRRLSSRCTPLCVVAVLAVSSLTITARAVAMSGHGHDDVGKAITTCLVAGACLAIVGGAFLLVRRRFAQRPRWVVSAFVVPALAAALMLTSVLVRAGPPRPLLQVYRF